MKSTRYICDVFTYSSVYLAGLLLPFPSLFFPPPFLRILVEGFNGPLGKYEGKVQLDIKACM